MQNNKYTICVVDDDPIILETTSFMLEKAGYNVITHSNGRDAVHDVMSDKVDLLLTDIAMPDMDGYQLYVEAKKLNEDLPIIMMTGFLWDPNHVIVRTRKIGLEDVLFKPFNAEKLVDRIHKVLNQDE